MAVFELEKLAVTLSKLRTWPNPSISVAHAYLYTYSTVFWTGDQPAVCLFSTSWRLRVADLALTKLSIPMPLIAVRADHRVCTATPRGIDNVRTCITGVMRCMHVCAEDFAL